MSELQIQTPQHVAIAYRVAPLSDRILAAFWDLLILISYSLGTFLIVVGLLELSSMTTLLLLIFLPVFLYHLVCEVFMDGQSFGKKIQNIKVVRLDGTPPTLGTYLLRWITRTVEIEAVGGSIALASIILSEKGQRLGDHAAGTCVVKIDTQPSLQDTIYRTLDDAYAPIYPQVENLTDEDVATVQDVLETAYRTGRTPAMHRLARQTQHALAQKMGLTLPPETQPLRFLQTVVKDYNAVMGRVGP